MQKRLLQTRGCAAVINRFVILHGRLSERWTVRRKAAVIQAVRGGWVPIEEIVRLYNLSVDEFLAWERDVDRYGVPGLRTTRFQIYRDTERRKR